MAIFAARIFVVIPPEPTSEAERPAMDSISGVICRTSRMNCALGSLFRIGCEQSFDVGEEDETIRARHLCDPGSERSIVAIADFRGGYRVILVDDR